MRWLCVFFIFILLLILPYTSGINKTECEMGGGVIVVPKVSSPGEPIKKELKPNCGCNVGYFWNNASKQCQDDSELRCKQTQGEWLNGNCKCPTGTMNWTAGFGCDTNVPVSSSEIKTDSKNKYLFIISAIFLILILFITLFFKRRKNEGN